MVFREWLWEKWDWGAQQVTGVILRTSFPVDRVGPSIISSLSLLIRHTRPSDSTPPWEIRVAGKPTGHLGGPPPTG